GSSTGLRVDASLKGAGRRTDPTGHCFDQAKFGCIDAINDAVGGCCACIEGTSEWRVNVCQVVRSQACYRMISRNVALPRKTSVPTGISLDCCNAGRICGPRGEYAATYTADAIVTSIRSTTELTYLDISTIGDPAVRLRVSNG